MLLNPNYITFAIKAQMQLITFNCLKRSLLFDCFTREKNSRKNISEFSLKEITYCVIEIEKFDRKENEIQFCSSFHYHCTLFR